MTQTIFDEMLETIQTEKKQAPRPAIHQDGGKLDVVQYMVDNGRDVMKQKEAPGGGTMFCLDACVFDPNHGPNEAAIIQANSGRLSYQCFHESCKGRTWAEARHYISGDEKLGRWMVGGNGKGHVSPNRDGTNVLKKSQHTETIEEWTPKSTAKNGSGSEDAETLGNAAASIPTLGYMPAKFKFIHNADILKNLKPIEWRIRDVLVENSFYYNFGDSGHYKTFVELDRCLCIAAGIDYHGHRVKQGTVFYIAGEGQQGIGRRIAVWHAIHGTKAAEVPFFISETATQLMDPGAVGEIRKAVDQMTAEYGPPALIAIDTLARNFGEGDENATKDMNRVISNMDASFRNDFLRSLNHHTGLANKERARGSYALHCAADSAFRVILTDQGQVLVECLKMKDAKPAPAMLFDRREVLLDIEGTPDRSYVLELAAEGDEALELSKSGQPGKVRGKTKSEALDILRGMYDECRCNLDSSGRPDEIGHITVKSWREACFDKKLFGARNGNFNRAAKKFHEDKLIQYDRSGLHVYLSGQNEHFEQF